MDRDKVIKGLECRKNAEMRCGNPCEETGNCKYATLIRDPSGEPYYPYICDRKKLCEDALALLKEQEANTYCGFVAWGMEIAPQQVAYAAVAERLIKCGVLKVQIEDRPTGTVCNYAIRAVEWND